jgi:hypothetical protein
MCSPLLWVSEYRTLVVALVVRGCGGNGAGNKDEVDVAETTAVVENPLQ